MERHPHAKHVLLRQPSGELARAVNQTHGPKPVKPEESAASLEEELGDVLYITLVLANNLHLDAGLALDGALARALKRAQR